MFSSPNDAIFTVAVNLDHPGNFHLKSFGPDKINLEDIDLDKALDEQTKLSLSLLGLCQSKKPMYLGQGVCKLSIIKNGQTRNISYKLPCDIVKRPRRNSADLFDCDRSDSDFRYELFALKIGEGAFGLVKKGFKTLVPSPDGMLFAKPSKYVIKLSNNKASLKPEASLGETIPHIRCKPLMFFDAGTHLMLENDGFAPSFASSFASFSYDEDTPCVTDSGNSALISRYIPGQTIKELLRKDDRNSIDLTIEDRLSISIALLDALIRLHDYGIVHRDIKPENILFNGKAEIIDLGVSESAINKTRSIAGTSLFLSPECCKGQGTSEKSDVFAMARILSHLWRADPHPARELKGEGEALAEVLKRNNCYEFTGLFKNLMDQLDPEEQDKIKNILLDMSLESPEKRCSAVQARKRFELILICRKANLINDKVQQPNFKTACSTVITCREKMRELIKKDPKNTEVLQELRSILTKHVQHVSIAAVENYFSDFIDMMGVKAFQGIKTSDDLIKKFDQIISEFNDIKFKYEELMKSIEDKEKSLRLLPAIDITKNEKMITLMFDLKKYINQCCSQYRLTIDNVVLITTKLAKKIQQSQQYFEQLSNLASGNSAASAASVPISDNVDHPSRQRIVAADRATLFDGKKITSQNFDSIVSKCSRDVKAFNRLLDVMNDELPNLFPSVQDFFKMLLGGLGLDGAHRDPFNDQKRIVLLDKFKDHYMRTSIKSIDDLINLIQFLSVKWGSSHCHPQTYKAIEQFIFCACHKYLTGINDFIKILPSFNEFAYDLREVYKQLLNDHSYYIASLFYCCSKPYDEREMHRFSLGERIEDLASDQCLALTDGNDLLAVLLNIFRERKTDNMILLDHPVIYMAIQMLCYEQCQDMKSCLFSDVEEFRSFDDVTDQLTKMIVCANRLKLHLPISNNAFPENKDELNRLFDMFTENQKSKTGNKVDKYTFFSSASSTDKLEQQLITILKARFENLWLICKPAPEQRSTLCP